MAQSVEELCRAQNVPFEQLVARSGLDAGKVQAILLKRWTPSPSERQKIAAVFALAVDEIVWGHATPIQHLYGSGPG